MVDASARALAGRVLVLLMCFVASMAFAAVIPLLWHDKLYVDGLTILRTQGALEPFGSSFASTAYLLSPVLDGMRSLGIDLDGYGVAYTDDLLLANGIFGGLFYVGMAVLVLQWRLRVDYRNVLVFAACVVLLAPFYFNITKELVLFVPTLFALALFRAGVLSFRGLLVLCVIILVVCGIYFRIYYLAFAVLLPVQWLLLKRGKALLALYLVAALMVVLFHDHLPLDLIRKGRALYLEGVSASRIVYPFDDAGGIGFLLNRAITFGWMLAPLNLLLISPTYAPFVLFQMYLMWRMIAAFRQPEKNVQSFAACAVLAFTMVSALFEPDYGSYFRHKISVLPFILLLIADFQWDRTEKEPASCAV